MPIGGIVGKATFVGNLGPFRELLVWGELIHVGKSCVKGNGWYVIEENTLSSTTNQADGGERNAAIIVKDHDVSVTSSKARKDLVSRHLLEHKEISEFSKDQVDMH
jgi:hypothetical protein